MQYHRTFLFYQGGPEVVNRQKPKKIMVSSSTTMRSGMGRFAKMAHAHSRQITKHPITFSRIITLFAPLCGFFTFLFFCLGKVSNWLPSFAFAKHLDPLQ